MARSCAQCHQMDFGQNHPKKFKSLNSSKTNYHDYINKEQAKPVILASSNHSTNHNQLNKKCKKSDSLTTFNHSYMIMKTQYC